MSSSGWGTNHGQTWWAVYQEGPQLHIYLDDKAVWIVMCNAYFAGHKITPSAIPVSVKTRLSNLIDNIDNIPNTA